MKYLIIFFTICAFVSYETVAQQYNIDGSMKVSKKAANNKYGFTPSRKHSIKVGSIRNEKAFLASLAGPRGERINFTRIGSCCIFKNKKGPFGRALLDKWRLRWEGQDEPIFLYLNGYEFKQPMCPAGLTIAIPNSNSL